MRLSFLTALASGAMLASAALAQAPANPSHAVPSWGVYHANSYAQASTAARGPEPGEALRVEYVPGGRINRASPWTMLGVPYADGSQPIWGVTLTHVLKNVLRPDGRLERVDTQRIDFNIASINWNFLTLADGKVYVMEPGRRQILRYADARPGDPDSPVALDGTFDFPPEVSGTSAHLNVTYDGWIVVPTDEGEVFAVRPDFQAYTVAPFTIGGGDTVGHNAFPVDEDGGIYFATQDEMTKVQWTGDAFREVWTAPYRFRNPGCPEPRSPLQDLQWTLEGNPCSGGGTTPTLMGSGSDPDRLVLAVDGHQPHNNLVAFWRDEIPADWQGLPGYDRRVAAVTPAAFATGEGDGYNTENSPTAWGYEIAFAQWNGIDPGPESVPGVQKFRWSPQTRTLDLAWANGDIALNNILTYSDGSGLVYGTGRQDGVYRFWALDWASGEVRIEQELGTGSEFVDGGNQLTVLPDRSLAYGSGEAGVVRIAPASAVNSEPSPDAEGSRLRVLPNPARGQIRVRFGVARDANVRLTLRTVLGREVSVLADRAFARGDHEVSASTRDLAAGTYLVRLDVGAGSTARRFVKVR